MRDQRFVDGRPDVLTYETPVLTAAGARAGHSGRRHSRDDHRHRRRFRREAHRCLSGRRSDQRRDRAAISCRSRWTSSAAAIATASSIRARSRRTSRTQIRFELPNVNHVFQPGHRIMVQIQSTLFPLYDRNPQTFVPNIFNAKPADYRKAEITSCARRRRRRRCVAGREVVAKRRGAGMTLAKIAKIAKIAKEECGHLNILSILFILSVRSSSVPLIRPIRVFS